MKRKNNPGKCCCTTGCGSIVVTVRLCSDSSLVSGALVTITDTGGTTIGSGTTTGTGVVTVTITVAADYNVIVSKSGQTTVTRLIAATCTTNTLTISFGRIVSTKISGCNTLVLPGAIVSLTTGGVTYRGITLADGFAAIAVPVNATFTVNVTHPSGRFNDINTSVTLLGGCAAGSFDLGAMTVATGYKCVSWGGALGSTCVYPYATTLQVTDSAFGAVTLTWSSGGVLGFPNVWSATKNVTVPACSPCAAIATTITYVFFQTTAGTSPLGIYTPSNLGCPGPVGSPSNSVNNGAPSTLADVTCPPALALALSIGAGAASAFCSAGSATVTE